MANEKNKKEAEPKTEEEKDTKEKVMPFLDHLEELRQRLIRCILSIVLFSMGSYFISRQIMQLLLKPYPKDEKLIFLAPTEGFIVHIKIAVFAGLILSLPVIFYQLWQFIAPGLYKKERRFIPLIVIFSSLSFLAGGAFCYFIIIPYGLNFLLGFNTDQLEAAIQIKEYLKFVTLLIMVFGIIFELPLLSYFLSRMGIVTPEFMRTKRRYGIVIIFIFAAILTPPDVVTQLFLAGPLIILYEISIWVAKLAQTKRKESLENDDS